MEINIYNEKPIQDAIEENIIKTIPEEERKHFKIFQESCQNFLNNIFNNYPNLGKYSLTLSNLKKNLYPIIKESQDLQTNLKNQLINFETALDTFLGRQIYLTFIDALDGSIIVANSIGAKEIYQNSGINSKGQRFHLNISTFKNLTQVNQEIQDELNLRARQKSAVYLTAIRRYNNSKNDEFHMDYNPSKNTFYWRNPDFYSHIIGWTEPLQQVGSIGEGFVRAVVNDNNNEIHNSRIEESLPLLYFNYMRKDSQGGILKGDVIFDDKEKISLAIKADRADSARFGQYLRMAYIITQLDFVNPELVQKNLRNWSLRRNFSKKSIEKLKKNIEKELKNYFS